MVGYSSLFGSVLGFVTKNIEQLCEERNCSSHFLPFFRDQKPETTDHEGCRLKWPISVRVVAMGLKAPPAGDITR
jgi:hypothetical protein